MTGRKDLLKRIRELALPLAERQGVTLVDEEFVKENGRTVLRLIIDKDGGVTLEDCENFSRAFSPVLDEEDPIDRAYYLEVASPGLDRPLKKPRDFEVFRGRMVRVTTFAPIQDRKEFVGKLLGLRDQAVHLELEDGKPVAIPSEMVARARLYVEW